MSNELKEAIQTDCDNAHKLIDRALDRVREAHALVAPLYKQSTKWKGSENLRRSLLGLFVIAASRTSVSQGACRS